MSQPLLLPVCCSSIITLLGSFSHVFFSIILSSRMFASLHPATGPFILLFTYNILVSATLPSIYAQMPQLSRKHGIRRQTTQHYCSSLLGCTKKFKGALVYWHWGGATYGNKAQLPGTRSSLIWTHIWCLGIGLHEWGIVQPSSSSTLDQAQQIITCTQ